MPMVVAPTSIKAWVLLNRLAHVPPCAQYAYQPQRSELYLVEITCDCYMIMFEGISHATAGYDFSELPRDL